MIDLDNLEGRFNEYKETILNLLISYYGEEYASIITERFNSIFFDFSSTPDEDYKYMCNHEDEISEDVKHKVSKAYNTFVLQRDEIVENKNKALLGILMRSFKIEFLSQEEQNEFLSLFTNNKFNLGLIDAFSVESDYLLKKTDVSQSVKDSILKDREELISRIREMNIEPRSQKYSLESLEKYLNFFASLFIASRETELRDYKCRIMFFTSYGKQVARKFCNAIGYVGELGKEDYVDLADMTIYTNGGIAISGNKPSGKQYHYLNVPLTHCVNHAHRSIDTNIIHEIIHQIESSSNSIGINIMSTGENGMLNEIRTQKNAIDICNMLHESGIFIYDNPEKSNVYGSSLYDCMIPLIEDFLNSHRELINDCSIRGTAQSLRDIFGDCWPIFNKELEKLYLMHTRNYDKTKQIIPVDKNNEEIQRLISIIEEHERKGNLSI